MAHAAIEANRGVPRQQGVEFQLRELGNARRRFLDRAVVDVLQHDPAAAEDRVAREEVSSRSAAQEERNMTVAMAWRFEDFQLEVADWNAISLPHLVRDLDRFEAVVRGVESGGLRHVQRDGPLISRS